MENKVYTGSVVTIVLVVVLWTTVPAAGAAGAATPSRAIDSEIGSQQDWYISGQVLTNTGQAAFDAEVRIVTANQELTDETDGAGEFNINVRGANIPESVLIVVTKDGFAGTAAIVEPGNRDIELVMLPEGKQTIEVFERSYHLGDGEFGGEINVRLSERVDGQSVEQEFRIGESQTSAEFATLFIRNLGSEAPNPVYLNGRQIGTLKRSPEKGRTGTQEIVFEPELLREGTNTVRFESRGSDGFYSDYDDFEVFDVRVRLEGVPVDRTRPNVSVSGSETPTVGGTGEWTVEANDENQVTALVATLWHDGEPVAHRTTTGSSLELDHQFEHTGTYELSVEAVDQSGNLRETTKTLSVGTPTRTATPEASDETETETEMAAQTAEATNTPSRTTVPGFGPVVVLLAIAVAVPLAIRRSRG